MHELLGIVRVMKSQEMAELVSQDMSHGQGRLVALNKMWGCTARARHEDRVCQTAATASDTTCVAFHDARSSEGIDTSQTTCEYHIHGVCSTW